jgi:hypothetical protein
MTNRRTPFIALLFLSLSTLHGLSQKMLDSTLSGSKNYHFSLHIFDTTASDKTKCNAVFTFYKFTNQKKVILRRDSLYCMDNFTDFVDFNNDGVKDLLIFHSTGARANPTYYLYLLDKKNLQLTRVLHFEDIPNPYLDSPANIIVGVGLAGSNYYSFYRLSKTNKLITLIKDVEEDPKDSLQYEKIIKRLNKNK